MLQQKATTTAADSLVSLKTYASGSKPEAIEMSNMASGHQRTHTNNHKPDDASTTNTSNKTPSGDTSSAEQAEASGKYAASRLTPKSSTKTKASSSRAAAAAAAATTAQAANSNGSTTTTAAATVTYKAQTSNDLSFFLQQQKENAHRNLISPQIRFVMFQFLFTTVKPFTCEFLTKNVLELIFKRSLLKESRRLDAKSPSDYLYQYGKGCNYFILILSGEAIIEVGKEKLEFPAGPFAYFGVNALLCGCETFEQVLLDEPATLTDETATTGAASAATEEVGTGSSSATSTRRSIRPYVPDFSLRVDDRCVYIKIDRDLWRNGVIKSRLEMQNNQISDNIDLSSSLSNDDNQATSVGSGNTASGTGGGGAGNAGNGDFSESFDLIDLKNKSDAANAHKAAHNGTGSGGGSDVMGNVPASASHHSFLVNRSNQEKAAVAAAAVANAAAEAEATAAALAVAAKFNSAKPHHHSRHLTAVSLNDTFARVEELANARRLSVSGAGRPAPLVRRKRGDPATAASSTHLTQISDSTNAASEVHEELLSADTAAATAASASANGDESEHESFLVKNHSTASLNNSYRYANGGGGDGDSVGAGGSSKKTTFVDMSHVRSATSEKSLHL